MLSHAPGGSHAVRPFEQVFPASILAWEIPRTGEPEHWLGGIWLGKQVTAVLMLALGSDAPTPCLFLRVKPGAGQRLFLEAPRHGLPIERLPRTQGNQTPLLGPAPRLHRQV